MARTLDSARHRHLVALIVQHREAAGLTQAEVARALGRHQPFVSNIESGQRRLDVIEFLALARVVGFDPHALLRELGQTSGE